MNFRNKKEIIGMIHLAGPNVIEKAISEIEIYDECGLSGIIIENYHGNIDSVIKTIESLDRLKKIKIGINILPNEFLQSFEIAKKYNLDFIQLDYVSGTYKPNVKLDKEDNIHLFKEILNSGIQILGGVWPKYYQPIYGSNLENDINGALDICSAIVVTGTATGQETSLDKIKIFKEILKDSKPLIIGAGVNFQNVKEQLQYAQGAIVGSAFKPNGDTTKTIDKTLVENFMKNVNDLNLNL